MVDGGVPYLVTLNLFLRKGNTMLPMMPTKADRATRAPRTDSWTHC